MSLEYHRQFIMIAMDSLRDIIGRKKYETPDEMAALRDYVSRKYQSSCRIKADGEALIMSVPSSALAATLQMEKPMILAKLKITKRLVIRIGR